MPIWGIDLGGTKIEGVILTDALEVVSRERIATEADGGYQHILDRIHQLIKLLRDRSGLLPDRIGMGTPGAIDPGTGKLKNSNTTCLNGKSFKEDLEKQIGVPFVFANDANCFAVAEAKMGSVNQALPQAQVVFGVIMGTGVGGGLIVGGRVINGLHGIAGEWGHNFLDGSGGACYCGKVGCVETILSGKALERYYTEQSGEKRNLKEIYQHYQAGNDAAALMTIDRLIRFFGIGMAQVINILDPDAIVLGGGVGNIDLLYTRGVEEVGKHVFNPELKTAFLKPVLGDSAGVFGAALLVS